VKNEIKAVEDNVAAEFKTVSPHLSYKTEENHTKSQRYATVLPVFESGTS